MKRRTFLAMVSGSLLAAPLAAGAQQPRKYTIGFLGGSTGPIPATQAFREGLRERGWVEGESITIEYRWTTGKTDQFSAWAEELVQLGADIIVVGAGNRAILSAKQITKTVPIVMAWSLDPVGSGLVTSMGRPGENVTGLTWDAGLEIGGKRVELLKAVAPGLSRAINLWDPGDWGLARYWPDVKRAAEALNMVAESAEVRSLEDLRKALRNAPQRRAGIFIWSGPLLNAHSREICDFALSHRLPTVSPSPQHVSQDGCLISYAPNLEDLYRRAAGYVHRILKGAKPADLPIEQPTKLELVINLKTAKALGLTIPRSLLLQADRVIE